MISKSKAIVIALLVIFGTIGGWLVYKTKARNNYQSQVVLAKELNKAMNTMMSDFRHAKASSVEGVPIDGQWYHEVSFKTIQEGQISYELSGQNNDQLKRINNGEAKLVALHMENLNLRRMPGDNAVLEVQIQARNNAQLTSNFKIRLLE